MHQDERLQNKYDRLCVEYNKLRTKQKELKDLTNSHLDTVKQLQLALDDKDSCIKQLERECETLRLENARLLECTQNAKTNGFVDVHANSEPKKMQEQIDSVLVSQTTPALADDVSWTPDRLGQLIRTLTETLLQWRDAIRSGEKPPEATGVKNALIEQIARLERQVCEVSLECQLERRRRLMLDKERSFTALNELSGAKTEAGSAGPVTATPPADQPQKNDGLTSCCCSSAEPHGGSESLMLDWMQQRIYTITDQARYFAARAAFLQDELSCLVPYVTELAEQALQYRTEASSARAALQQMQTDLDRAHSNALRQSSELAEHIANLTDELQELRAYGKQYPHAVERHAGGSASLQQSSSATKKGSIFNVLKR